MHFPADGPHELAGGASSRQAVPGKSVAARGRR